METKKPDYDDIFVIDVNGDGSVLIIHHNKRNGKDPENYASLFQVEYKHPVPVKVSEGGFFEIRIDEYGDKPKKATNETMCVGIGFESPATKFGVMVDQSGTVMTQDGSMIRIVPEHSLVRGDVIRMEINKIGEDKDNENGKPYEIVFKHEKYIIASFPVDDEEFSLLIGMNNMFERLTLMRNKCFSEELIADPNNFQRNLMRILVCSMNEGSPKYGKGVAKGGHHLLLDGTLVRRLAENDIKIVNYNPGAGAGSYDAKYGANCGLPEFLPDGLRRIRLHCSGNELIIRHSGGDEYSVQLKSVLTGQEESFQGTAEEWIEERDDLFNNGEKYLIDLPAKNGSLQTNDLLIAGTKCRSICNIVASSLAWRVHEDKCDIPAVLLLGGDRSQSIGSITGAAHAYEDLCYLYFDAHFDMRDPNASKYPMVHGSPLFLLLQEDLRESAKKWQKCTDQDKSKDPKIGDAIKFLNSTPEGKAYWENLIGNESAGYRGFDWLKDANYKEGKDKEKNVKYKRLAFVGNRATDWEAGSSLGGPLPNLFKNLLHLDDQIYTSEKVRSRGVKQIFKEIVNQWRSTFPKEKLEEKDKEAKERGDEKWIPPIMVSWDTDSIDPNAFPCTIAQEANGLSGEECLAFCDEVADTKKMVFMEAVEFNPELWNGYLDEPITMTLNDFIAGPYANSLREPQNKSSQRLDLQLSTKLLQDMVVRITKLRKNKVNADEKKHSD